MRCRFLFLDRTCQHRFVNDGGNGTTWHIYYKQIGMCKFTLPFSGSAASVTGRAASAVRQAGGSFEGDETAGHFLIKVVIGTISGSYSITNQELSIVVNKKPLLLSCRKIENELAKVLT